MTDDELAAELEAQRQLMVAVATGGPRIGGVNQEYVKRRAAIAADLRRRGLKDPNPYGDLWAWYAGWTSGNMSTWAARRAHVAELYQPLIDQVRDGSTVSAEVAIPAKNTMSDIAAPRVLISYSHDTPTHKQWVLSLATRLRLAGVDVILDQWDLKPGMDIPVFMERSISAAARVVVVLTENYVRKADERLGGVGYETVLMTSEILANLDTHRFIPVVRQTASPTLPRGFGARYYIDFSRDSEFESCLEQLLRELHAAPALRKPALGPNPFAGANPVSTTGGATTQSRADDWQVLLLKAKAERIWVELEARIFVEVRTVPGRKERVETEVDGLISVASVGSGVFELGIPVQGRGGITIVATPHTVTENIWMGSEYRLHVALRKDILLKNGTSVFIDR